jgi:hypothetical protein
VAELVQVDADVMGYKKTCGLCRNVKEIWLVTPTGKGREDRTCFESMGAENPASARTISVTLKIKALLHFNRSQQTKLLVRKSKILPSFKH